jgi:PmbA protein
MALRCEEAAFKTHRRVSNSEGAGVSAQQSHFFTAHTNGFRGGYASSRHSMSVAPIAKLPGKNGEMQRDYWYSSMRNAADLASPEAVGRYAAERTLSRLGSRKIPTTECPVLFESPLAAGLLGSFVQAVSGSALYRKSTSCSTPWASPSSPSTSISRKTPSSWAARAARPLTKRACACRRARWSMPAAWKAISCPATRRASWA